MCVCVCVYVCVRPMGGVTQQVLNTAPRAQSYDGAVAPRPAAGL